MTVYVCPHIFTISLWLISGIELRAALSDWGDENTGVGEYYFCSLD